MNNSTVSDPESVILKLATRAAAEARRDHIIDVIVSI